MTFTLNTTASEVRDGSSSYLLKTGKEGSEILDRQHQLLAKDSYAHVEKAGLGAGQTVWDIGCGGGAMTEHFARMVGNAGRVYALDASRQQLDVARSRIENLGLANVTFFEGDILSAEHLPAGKADLVYTRYLFMHLTDPEKGLENVRLLLKAGGMLALQESILSTTHVSQPNADIDEYIQTIVATGKHKGVDYDIGKRLLTLCENGGFKDAGSYYLQNKIPAYQAKPLLISRVSEFGGQAIEAGLATREKLEQWRKAIEMFPENDPDFYFSFGKQSYIIAQKN